MPAPQFGVYAGVMALTSLVAESDAAPPTGYLKPPQAIRDVLDAPPPPNVSVSPTRDHVMLLHSIRYPALADVAAPMLRLAGLRINPRTNGPHLPPMIHGLTLQSLADDPPEPFGLPVQGPMNAPFWAPDGKRFAFSRPAGGAYELWVGDVPTRSVRRIDGVRLNNALGDTLEWLPDSRTLLCHTIAADRGPPPAPPAVPTGPNVQESSGPAGPVRTFQDLLQTPYDEALFDYYTTSQLALVDVQTNSLRPFGPPGIFVESEPSPDGHYILVSRVERPYSYLYTFTSFPRLVEVWNREGAVVHTVARLPLQDKVPIEGVPTGPRQIAWRPTRDRTLVWVEALDDGDPKKKVPHRERLMTTVVPPKGPPQEIARLEQRFAGLTWGEKGGLMFVRDYDRDRRWVRTFAISADRTETPHLVWERSIHDRYGDPGTPMLRRLPNGQPVLWQHGENIFLVSNGATPHGDRPFLDRFDLGTHKSERLFRCGDGAYEGVVALLSPDGSRFLTVHQSPHDPPNYYVRRAGTDRKQEVTRYRDPTPQLRGITKKLVTYQRPDGVALSFTLYLPPDYKEGTRLPTVVWAYPLEFIGADTAGQVVGSPDRFTTITGPSHLFFLLAGYAVLDGASMPVVGPPETANDTFIDQIVASAKAAIDKAAEMGVTDPKRVGVGGHSYGAFMTANLLAHSDLFRAGIARSGAYNRTLTPFGFQSERRTFWEAPEIYAKVSPFQFAHKIKAPLLLIHGEADNNPGTFPVQSERMYHAIRGNGGTVRYVTLPHESHGYVARESVEHTLYEMIAWFDRYVKNADATRD
jgi:dipeptidyl aminopeptidase/acylaminoacyl peptidase